MIDHCNRWLLGFAAAYLALLPTNVATFAHSVAYVGGIVFALCALGLALRWQPHTMPAPGWTILAPLLAWSAWSLASISWSIDPRYSSLQVSREIGNNLVAMLVFYVATRDARSFRVLVATALASFAVLALLAIGMALLGGGAWDAGRWHHGVGPWSTWTVLIAPLIFVLVAPPPAGFGSGARAVAAGLGLLALIIVTDRLTDNRIVWVALAGVFGVASLVAALRWPHTLVRAPLRWIGPLLAMLLVLGVAFTDAVRERAAIDHPHVGVATSLERDPRIALWEAVRERIESRPWTGYGFGRRVLANDLSTELHDPLMAHAHNTFASQWLQTGLVGMLLFGALLGAIFYRYMRFLSSPDDTLAFIGLVGITLMAGFLIKNLTDDFLFRSNAKEFWVLCAMLLGYGMRRAHMLRTVAPPGPAPDAARAAAPRTAVRERAAELIDD